MDDAVAVTGDAVVDVGDAGAAFYFSGKSHSVADSLIFNQSKDFSVQRGTDLKRDQIDWRDSKQRLISD